MKLPIPRKRHYSQFLSRPEVVLIIARKQAHEFCDGMVWIKESNWDRKGTVLVYDYSYIGEFYYFIRKGFFEESASTASNKEGFSIFSHTPCPLYAENNNSVAKKGPKSNSRSKEVVSSLPHLLKIISRTKDANDIKMRQLRFAVT